MAPHFKTLQQHIDCVESESCELHYRKYLDHVSHTFNQMAHGLEIMILGTNFERGTVIMKAKQKERMISERFLTC